MKNSKHCRSKYVKYVPSAQMWISFDCIWLLYTTIIHFCGCKNLPTQWFCSSQRLTVCLVLGELTDPIHPWHLGCPRRWIPSVATPGTSSQRWLWGVTWVKWAVTSTASSYGGDRDPRMHESIFALAGCRNATDGKAFFSLGRDKQKPSPCDNRWSSDFPARLYPGSLSTGSVAEASRQGTWALWLAASLFE